MRKIFYILIIVVSFLITLDSYSQIYGIKTGINFSDMVIDYPVDYPLGVDYNMHVGIDVEFPIYNFFSLNTGMYFNGKGFNTHIEIYNSHNESQNLKLYYLDFPLKAKLNFDIGNSSIYGFFGTYIGVGLFGSLNEKSIKWGTSNNNNYNRFDIGIMAGYGIEVYPIQISLSYGLGLLNTNAIVNGETSAFNRNLLLSAGYIFKESSFEKDNTYVSLNPKTGIFIYLNGKSGAWGPMLGSSLNYRYDNILLSFDYNTYEEFRIGKHDAHQTINLFAGVRNNINEAVFFDLQLGAGLIWQEISKWQKIGLMEYSTTIVTESAVGLFFNSGIKFCPTRYFAIGLNVQGSVNSMYSYLAIPIVNIEIGLIRE